MIIRAKRFFIVLKRMVNCHPFFLVPYLLLGVSFSAGAVSEFSPTVKAAYTEILKLKVETGRRLIKQEINRNPNNSAALLVENYTDFLTLVISQDPALYKSAVEAQEARLDRIEENPEKSPYYLYAQAEIKMQLACSQFFFDDEFKAGWNIRQAFLLLEQNQKLYPDFYPNRKSLGLLQFVIGSVPDSYKWILSLIGMKANIKTGIKNLALAADNNHPFQIEAAMLHYYVADMLYREAEAPLQYFTQQARNHPDNLLFAFMAVSIQQKRKKCDLALASYQKRPVAKAYLPITFMHHMAADMYLFKGDYTRSLQENQFFLANYKGSHYVKDAHYKMYLASLLKPETTPAKTYLNKILHTGTDFVEEDQIALKFAKKPQPVHLPLLKTRLHTDGGFYQEAMVELQKIDLNKLQNLKDKIEYFYRSGRIYQGRDDLIRAKEFYLKTISLNGDLPYYFAPNAALQLGFLALDANDKKAAKYYFQKVLAYPKHDYKRSIDSKAKVALGNI